MNKFIVRLLGCFLLASSFSALAATAESVSTTVEDRCRAEIMQVGTQDSLGIDHKALVDACTGFPLSDDIFVQILGGLIGPSMIPVMDVYQGFSGVPHGFKDDEPLFVFSAPFHAVLKLANEVFLWVLLSLIALVVGEQVIRWMRREKTKRPLEWMGREGVSHFVSVVLSLPIIGWMTPLQFIGVAVVVLLGAMAKYVATYLLLASFFSSVGTASSDSLKEDSSVDFARAVLIQRCDLGRREALMSAMQIAINSKSEAELSKVPLYQCLTSGAVTPPKLTSLPSGSDIQVTYSYTPSSVQQTENCIAQYSLQLKQWGATVPASCNSMEFALPNNTALPASLDNAISLYASSQIITKQRELALKVREYECRAGNRVRTFLGDVVSDCLIASIAQDGYKYTFTGNPVTGAQELAYYNTAMSDQSKDIFVADTKSSLLGLQRQVEANLPGMLQHVKDLLAPFQNEADVDELTQARRDALEASLTKRLQETGGLGMSLDDVKFLVNNIQRGPWAVSSVFFGALADGVSEKSVVNKMANVFSVPTGVLDTVFYTDLLVLKDAQASPTDRMGDPFVEGNPVLGLIIPRTGLYLENVSCWYRQVNCDVMPLNPFQYLGERGVQLIDRATIGYVATSSIQKIAKMFIEVRDPRYSRFMALDVISEFQMLYLIIGIVLSVMIPALPFVKIVAMMVSWAGDVLRELFSLQLKLSLTPLSEHGEGVLHQDISEGLKNLVGLGFYFLFMIVGVFVMFLMFSMLFAMNVFLVGILSSAASWGGTTSTFDVMLLNLVFDCIIAFLLLYQVHKCVPFIEMIPKELGAYYEIKVTPTGSVVEQVFMYIKGHVAPGMSKFLHEVGRG